MPILHHLLSNFGSLWDLHVKSQFLNPKKTGLRAKFLLMGKPMLNQPRNSKKTLVFSLLAPATFSSPQVGNQPLQGVCGTSVGCIFLR